MASSPTIARSACCAAIFVMLLMLTPLARAEEGSGPNVSLRWALAARDTDDAEPIAVTEDRRLSTGSSLKLLLEPLSPGAVYLILLDSSDKLHVLYRETLERVGDAERTYIPPEGQWFELGEPSGLETFFLLASVEQLKDLDRLLDTFAGADSASREQLGPEIVREIRRQHKAHRRFSRPVEKPVLSGGQTRGDVGIDQFAAEITAEGFYGKTITIEH